MKQANKKPYSIDETHSSLLKQFQENDEVLIPKLKKEIENLRIKSQQLHLSQIETYLEIQDKIEQKKETIKQLRNKGKKYLLENSAYIFDYFEKKKDISVGGGKQNENVLNTFFKIRATNESAANIDSGKYNPSKQSYHNYWKNVENEIMNFNDYIVPFDRCYECAKGELIPQDEEGIMICNNESCGKFIPYIVDSSKPTNKEPPNEVSYTAYIRLNHFKEILSQFQAKETTQIPDEIIDNIFARIKKERIQQSELDYDKMREILRKLGYNKYFEHIQYINSLFGIKPPVMSEELHDTLCVLFIEIQKPWATHCPANRTNFFNYAYTLYQLCTLLDQVQYLPFIPMMKDREKQLEQDMIWKKVCNDLDWQFFPTV